MPHSSVQYRVGDIVVHTTFTGLRRRVRVTRRAADIKGGQPGFDGKLVDAEGRLPAGTVVWGYDEQVERVEPRQ